MRVLLFVLLTTASISVGASDTYPWYTQGKFTPEARIEFTISNPLDFDRQHCPVIIKRENSPNILEITNQEFNNPLLVQFTSIHEK